MILHTDFQARVPKDTCRTEGCGASREESNGMGEKDKFKAETDTALTRNDELAGC